MLYIDIDADDNDDDDLDMIKIMMKLTMAMMKEYRNKTTYHPEIKSSCIVQSK